MLFVNYVIRLIMLFNAGFILGIYNDSIIFLKRRLIFCVFVLSALLVQTYNRDFLLTFC